MSTGRREELTSLMKTTAGKRRRKNFFQVLLNIQIHGREIGTNYNAGIHSLHSLAMIPSDRVEEEACNVSNTSPH